MKKLFIALIAIAFASCSQEQEKSVTPVATSTGSVLDDGMLSYKDNSSFIKEYSALTEMKSSKEVHQWISKKGHSSLLNIIDTIGVFQDKIDNPNVIYSDALKAILNKDSKFKIGTKTLWLNENKFYELTDRDKGETNQELVLLQSKLEVVGTIDGKLIDRKSDNLKTEFPRTNGYSVSYTNDGPDKKRYQLILFVEAITVNGAYSSKVFAKSIMYYRRCPSFKSCYWRLDDVTIRLLTFNISVGGCGTSSVFYPGSNTVQVIGEQSILIGGQTGSGVPCAFTGIEINGNIITQGFNGYIWTQGI